MFLRSPFNSLRETRRKNPPGPFLRQAQDRFYKGETTRPVVSRPGVTLDPTLNSPLLFKEVLGVVDINPSQPPLKKGRSLLCALCALCGEKVF